MKEITYLKAINEAVDEEMARDSSIFIIGEDVGRAWGGGFGEFLGLYEKYGDERVRGTPISETAILGSAIGAAATGMRPIANIMYADFMGVCGDEVMNQLLMRYAFGGTVKLPLTIMVSSGAGLGEGVHHTKSLQGWLITIPGLRIVTPATAYDAKGLLKSAIREDNPVYFAYHKFLLMSTETTEIPEEEYIIPLGKADIKKEGSDVTVVATELMVHRALAAAEKLQEKGISIEVVDPRTWVPLDTQTILDSVRKTGRLVVMTEEGKTGSAAGEISAIVAEEAFDSLDAPIKRVCGPNTPVPACPVLEKRWMPDEEDL
ncbi:alpha-ketoacid dehydrogenase subunit beta, partial [Chloroflexota bacterium]